MCCQSAMFHRGVSTGCFVINTDSATCRPMVTLTLVALTIEIRSQTTTRWFFGQLAGLVINNRQRGLRGTCLEQMVSGNNSYLRGQIYTTHRMLKGCYVKCASANTLAIISAARTRCTEKYPHQHSVTHVHVRYNTHKDMH